MKTLAKYLALFLFAFAGAGAAGYLGLTFFTRSAPEVILPELTGKNIIPVLETLTRLGLNPRLKGTQYHDTVPRYAVSFQDPIPGSTIKKGRDVVIYISKGIREHQMPELRQLPYRQAMLTLEDSGLKPGTISRVHSPDTLKNSVIAQYPLPMATVTGASACDLLVSLGPRPGAAVMPDLTGMPVNAAASRINDLGLELARVSSGTDTRKPQGRILSQAPGFGAKVMAGTLVRLTVNTTRTGLEMDPGVLEDMTLVTHTLGPGYANQHVRVTLDLWGDTLDFYNEYMKPGKEINILIPGGIKTMIRIFVDQKLVGIREIDPWRTTSQMPWTTWGEGEQLWE